MKHLTSCFLKRFLHLNFPRFLLTFSLLGSLIPAYALESIWYSDKDLKEDNIQLIPQGYIDLSVSDPCSQKTYDKPLSLVEVTEAALCHNPQTREVYANAKVQSAQVGVARSLFFPSVTDTLSVTENKNRTTNYSNATNRIVASYLLYDFGSRDANFENANQLLRAASASQNATVQTVLLTAVNAFYQVHANRAILNASIETERLSQESFKAAEAKYIAGVATPADKLQAQTSFANATLTKLRNEGTLKVAYGNLANVMGAPANINFQIADSNLDDIPELVDQDIDALIEQARLQRPDLMASEAQLKASLAKIEAVKADAKPKVRIDASNQYDENSLGQTSQNTSQLGIFLSIPLFEGYKPTFLIRSAEATAELNASKRDQLKLQVSLDVWTAYQNLKTANESITASNVLLLSAEESSRLALGRYKEGVGNIIDTLNAQSALANAKQQKIQSVLNWNIARTTLAQSIGVLDNAMIQKLPEKKRQ
ncbi:TolC family protein [Candidatus Methylopumilus universalis]|jgi:outer membrane protein|uniref:Protein CyaE n=1 Tax=Candidatus Methylopumilus universalis TaxID=2588536 RepID=A0AAX1F1C3_9PROT|nr:TolC family protein [Candidatus Methylopumilus universalis]QDC42941.1 TolC family protein [Candidatus Methylopumilus universalis]QDC55330.1 TolC family protein [Candidatus Methylopumilus universalis]QDC56609.1 TolC family protein [Candidatus Methylopumilus universalis]QDC57900.1 TolC family protein [Candidatus Methylopumilus universalis]